MKNKMVVDSKNWRLVNPKSPQEIETEFDDISGVYDSKLESMGYRAPKDSADILAKHLEKGDAHILDAGCGTGLVGVHLRSYGFTRITGVDISLKSLEEADKKNVYIDTQKHNLLERFPFENNTFDAIVCIGVWSRFNKTEILSLLKEFARISARGAVILASHREDLLKASGLIDEIHDNRYANLKLTSVTKSYLYMGFDENYSDVKVRYLILRKI